MLVGFVLVGVDGINANLLLTVSILALALLVESGCTDLANSYADMDKLYNLIASA